MSKRKVRSRCRYKTIESYLIGIHQFRIQEAHLLEGLPSYRIHYKRNRAKSGLFFQQEMETPGGCRGAILTYLDRMTKNRKSYD